MKQWDEIKVVKRSIGSMHNEFIRDCWKYEKKKTSIHHWEND